MQYNIERTKKSSIFMCLTIPKKVLSVDGQKAVVSRWDEKENQEVATIVKIEKGDWVLTQNGIIIEKIDEQQAQEIINLVKENE